MNNNETIKYNKLKEEIKLLKKHIEKLESENSDLINLIIDLYAMMTASATQFGQIWIYFREIYPNFLIKYEEKAKKRLVDLWTTVKPRS